MQNIGGRYDIELPFKKQNVNLPNNRSYIFNCMIKLEQRFKKDDALKTNTSNSWVDYWIKVMLQLWILRMMYIIAKCGINPTFALTRAKSLEMFLIARQNFKASV